MRLLHGKSPAVVNIAYPIRILPSFYVMYLHSSYIYDPPLLINILANSEFIINYSFASNKIACVFSNVISTPLIKATRNVSFYIPSNSGFYYIM